VLEQLDTSHAKAAINEELRAMPPRYITKLVEKNNDMNKLTKKEIISLLLTCFAVKEDVNKKRKGDIVALLSREIEAHHDRIL
jgi:hypothetical protein